jgi:hypothetical protein
MTYLKPEKHTFVIDYFYFCVYRSWNFTLVVRIFNEVFVKKLTLWILSTVLPGKLLLARIFSKVPRLFRTQNFVAVFMNSLQFTRTSARIHYFSTWYVHGDLCCVDNYMFSVWICKSLIYIYLHLRFWRRWLWRFPSYGMWRLAVGSISALERCCHQQLRWQVPLNRHCVPTASHLIR